MGEVRCVAPPKEALVKLCWICYGARRPTGERPRLGEHYRVVDRIACRRCTEMMGTFVLLLEVYDGQDPGAEEHPLRTGRLAAVLPQRVPGVTARVAYISEAALAALQTEVYRVQD